MQLVSAFLGEQLAMGGFGVSGLGLMGGLCGEEPTSWGVY